MTVNQDAISYPDIIQNVSEQVNLATDIAAKLRACTSETEIFQTAVRWAKAGVDGDRAVIYNLQAADRGKIIAEAVDPQYPKTLGSVIIDPCFEARYIDKYQMGRVRAIANIHQAGMTPCYIENLEKIGVKASLVVPILGAASLRGLLVIHHCGHTHRWTQAEIDLAIQIATQVGYALDYLAQSQECDRLRQELEQAAAWQQILTKIAKKLQAPSRLEVLQIAVRQTQMLLKCDRVVVYSLYASSKARIIAETTQPALAPLLGRQILDPCFDYSYAEQYQNGRVRAIDNIFTAGLTACYIETLHNIGVKSNLVAPILFDNGQLLGLLVAHSCFELRQWQPDEIDRIQQVALQTGFALAGARMQEKQVRLRTATTSLTTAETTLRQAVTTSEKAQAIAEELTTVFGEIRNLSRLLSQETIQSTQATPAEAQQLLQIIARRLQGNVEHWESLQAQTHPQQQEIAALLKTGLTAIESCHF
jgi:GAF domain-containing protein